MVLTYSGRGLRSHIHECLHFIYAFPFLVRGGTFFNSDELHRIERCIRIVVIHFGSGCCGDDVDEAGDDGVIRVSLEAIRLSPGHIAFPALLAACGTFRAVASVGSIFACYSSRQLERFGSY